MGCEEDWRKAAMKWGKIEGERWKMGQAEDGADGRGRNWKEMKIEEWVR
jgi:hypothetical protein